MSNIRYILLILIIFPFIELCAQNEVQSSINQVLDSCRLGKYKEPIPLLESIIIKDDLTSKQSNCTQMLLEIAYFNAHNFKFDLARLENTVNRIEHDDPSNIIGFKTLINLNNNIKNYENSLTWGKKGLKAFKKFKKNVFYAELLSDVSNCYYYLGDYKNSIKSQQMAIDIIDRYYGGNHRLYASWLRHFSSCYEELENYPRAIDYELQALSREKDFLTYLSLERLYKKNGDTEKAIEAHKKSGAMYNSFNLNKAINNLIYNDKYADLISLKKKDIAIQKELVDSTRIKYGELHKSYAQALSSLAKSYSNEGIYDSAIKYQTLALNIISINLSLGSKSEITGTIHEQLNYSAKNVFQKYDYTTASQNLAFYYGKNGNYTKAIDLEDNTIKILQEIIGVNDTNRVSALSKRKYFGITFNKDSDLGKLALCLHNLAFWYAGIEDYNKAIKLDTEALIIQKEISKNLDYDGTRIIETLALNYLEIKDYENSYKMLQEAFDLRKEIVLKKFLLFISKERETYWNSKKNFFQDLPQFAIEAKDPYNSKVASICYDAMLFSKGLLLNTSVEIDKLLVNSGDTISIQLYNRLRQLNNKPDIRVDEDSIASIERELLKRSKVFGDITHELHINWKDIQPVLISREVAIEFSVYNSGDKTLYCALLLKKGMEYPVMVPLFEQKQLDSLLAGGNAMPNSLYATRGVTAYYGDQLPNGHKLYNLIWKPLEKELQNVKTVYYSPSGSLHQISFAALPTDTAHYLCDKYNLVQLSSTRKLATSALQTKPEQISSTALYGGIKYDLDAPEITELQRSFPKNDLALGRGFTYDSSLRSTSFGFLPGTKDEVNSIATTLQTKKIKTYLYTGINGNEETFKALSNQNISVLHIATHGFFYPDEKEKPQDLDRMMLMGEQKYRYVPNPLRRSGLILAGGNHAWNGEEPVAGMEDGILTAQEISEMNLQNTELVVLSACETGLGDIKGGEGVFGLQRAFKMAGVKTIIMSLWKVPDGSTSEMMQLFYSKWLGGMDKQEAFRETQREMRNRYPKSPKDWAGFVMLD